MAFREKNAAQRALNDVRGLIRDREDRDRASVAYENSQNRQADLGRQALVNQGQLSSEGLRGRLSAAEAERGRMFSKEQAATMRKYEADRDTFGAFKEGRLTPEQAATAGMYLPGSGYRYGDIGQLQPQAGRGVKASSGGALTAKNLFDIRKGLNAEFYGDNPAGEALRKKYGENGFGMFATQMEQRYQPQQQSGISSLPQPSVTDQPYGTISRGGQVIAGSTGGLPTDPEAFATQLKQGLRPEVQPGLQPVAQQQAQQQTLQPAGMMQDRSSLYQALESPIPDNELFPLQPSIPGGESALGSRKKPRLGLLPDTVRGLGRSAGKLSSAVGRFTDPNYSGNNSRDIRKEVIPMRKYY